MHWKYSSPSQFRHRTILFILLTLVRNLMVNSWNSESWPFATFEIFVLKCISEKYDFVLQCNDAIHRDYPFKCTIATTRAYRINCTQTGYLLQENFLVGFLDGHFSTRQRMKVCWNVNRLRSFKTPSFVDPIVKTLPAMISFLESSMLSS